MCLTAMDFCAVSFQRWKLPWRNVEVKFHNLNCDKILFYLILNFITPLKQPSNVVAAAILVLLTESTEEHSKVLIMQ